MRVLRLNEHDNQGWVLSRLGCSGSTTLGLRTILHSKRAPAAGQLPGWYHHRTVRQAIGVLASLLLHITHLNYAHSESSNGWVRGSRKQLERLASQASKRTCDRAVCPLGLTPIELSVRTASSRLMRLTLTSAELSAPLTTTSRDGTQPTDPQSVTTRRRGPVLLRGWLHAPHTAHDRSRSRPLPVAAALTHSSSDSQLYITAPLGRRNQRGRQGRLTALRVAVSEVSSPRGRNARAESPSPTSLAAFQCGANDTHSLFRSPHDSTVKPLTAAPITYPALYIATDFDSRFAERIRCSSLSRCNDAIIRIIHGTSVFYETQLGYTLAVARQFGPTEIGDVTVATEVLNAVQQRSLVPRLDFVHTGTSTVENQVDLFQFFTGRTMEGKTIGIAYVGTLCRNDRSEFSQSIVQHVSDGLNPITTAHEVGHALSATHTSSGIMRANLSGSTPREFASTSLAEMSGYLNTSYAECRRGMERGVITPTPTPRPGGGGSTPSNPYVGKPVTLDLRVKSPVPRTVTFTATVTSLAPGCSVTIRSGITSLRSLRGEPLTQFSPVDLTTVRTGTVSFRVKPTKTSRFAVYFVAEHSCSDGTILEVSRVRRFNPNSVRGISRSQRSKKRWIEALRQSVSATTVSS